MSRFQFVADHRDTFEVKWLCKTVKISRSSFYDWLAPAPACAEPADTPVPDLLKRDFIAPAPNLKYVSDITYLPFGDGHTSGNLYLATVIDCFSRRLVG